MKIQQWLFELLRKQSLTDGRTDGQRENSIPPTNKVCGGYNESTLADQKGVPLDADNKIAIDQPIYALWKFPPLSILDKTISI